MLKFMSKCVAVLVVLAGVPFAAALQPDEAAPGTLNEKCPMSGRGVVATVPVVEHLEQRIGFCCPGCRQAFLGWEDDKKFEYIADQVALRAERDLDPPALVSRSWKSDLFALDACPVSGRGLGDEPVVLMVNDREVRLCCERCIPRFEAQENRWEKIDQRMAEDQRRWYPLEVCVVSGRALGDSAVEVVHRNRLVRLCCSGCRGRLAANASEHLGKLDAAVIEKQRARYPMDKCIVRGRALGVAGQPVEAIVAGRLLRLCCEACAEGVKQDPAAIVARIDGAWGAMQEGEAQGR